MLDFVKLYFLHDGYDYLRFHRVACFFCLCLVLLISWLIAS